MAKKYVEIDGVKMEVKKAKKPFYKRIWVWGLGLIIVASIASGGGNDDGAKNGSKAQEPKTAAVQKDEKKEEVKAYNVGQVAKVADVGFTVVRVQETKTINSGNQFIDNATTDGKFVLVDVKIDNGKKQALTINSSYFKINVNGAEYEPVTDGEVMMAMGDKMNDFFLQQINPGLSKTGTVVFELPADADLLKANLHCQTGAWGTESIEINLKKGGIMPSFFSFFGKNWSLTGWYYRVNINNVINNINNNINIYIGGIKNEIC